MTVDLLISSSLLVSLLHNVLENMSDYFEYTVITKIEYVNEFPMTLPAITLCLASFVSYYFSTNATLEESFLNCHNSYIR